MNAVSAFLLRHPRKTVAFVLVLAIAAFGLSKLMGGGGAGGGPGGFGVAVEAAKVEAAPLTHSVSAVGTLIANEGIIVRPEIAGRVSEILFTEGQLVEKGTPLLRLDDSIFKAQLAQAQAEKALAERTYNRAQALVGRGAGTEQSRDEAAAQQRTASAALELAQANLDKTLITAPFTGTVGLRQISMGDFVSPGQTLVSLQALNVLKVDFSVPETELGQLRIGLPVALTVTAYPGETFSGEVSAIDPLIDPSTRSVQLRARIPNDSGKLRPGQFASVTLTLGEQARALFVPSAAVWPMGDKIFVFRIKDGMASLTPITISARLTDRVAVSGLNEGDEVATSGHAKLMMFGQGQPTPVNVTNATAADAATPDIPPAPEGH